MKQQPTYPGYDVLDKQDTPSWDAITRHVVEQRIRPPPAPQFLDLACWRTLEALCARIIPQRGDQPLVPLAAMIDQRLKANAGEGFRHARLPPLREAWCIGLQALDAHSREQHELPFASLDEHAQIVLLTRMQHGQLNGATWRGMPADLFFSQRVLGDICGAYYAHPSAWNQLGFGGPANPRGYVRMYENRRDPWEAVEARNPEDVPAAREANQRVR